MKDFEDVVVSVPSWIDADIRALAEQVGESVDAVCAYFFAKEVVHP